LKQDVFRNKMTIVTRPGNHEDLLRPPTPLGGGRKRVWCPKDDADEVARAGQVEEILDAIAGAERIAKIDQRKILVTPVDEVVRIHTGFFLSGAGRDAVVPVLARSLLTSRPEPFLWPQLIQVREI